MSIDQFFEFGWICVDQGLNLVLEDHAILRKMLSTRLWYPHLALTLYPLEYGTFLGFAGMTEIP